MGSAAPSLAFSGDVEKVEHCRVLIAVHDSLKPVSHVAMTLAMRLSEVLVELGIERVR